MLLLQKHSQILHRQQCCLIYLVLEDSEVLMKTGDTCVQRRTNHAWSNRADTDCYMMFVLVDGTFN